MPRPQDQSVAVTRRTARPSVRDMVVDLILGGDLKGGDALPPEGRIAETLGVSRSSVREAVKSLEATGVVEVRHGVGLFLRPFSLTPIVDGLRYALLDDLTDLSHLLELRQSLEIGLADTIIARRDPAQIEALRDCLTDMRAKAEAGEGFAEQDRAFHAHLLGRIVNPLYGRLTDTFWLVFHRAAEARPALRDGDPMASWRDHVAIVDALDAGARADFAAAIRAHYDLLANRVRAADRTAP